MNFCRCVVCGKAFVKGDMLQGFLRSPDDPRGGWSEPGEVDGGFQHRWRANENDTSKRKHEECVYKIEEVV